MICVEYYQRILITGIFYYIPFAGFFLSLCGISFCHLPSRASEAQSLLALTKNHLPRAIVNVEPCNIGHIDMSQYRNISKYRYIAQPYMEVVFFHGVMY